MSDPFYMNRPPVVQDPLALQYETQLDRIERKLDALIAALAEGEEPELTLDGEYAGQERDQTQPL